MTFFKSIRASKRSTVEVYFKSNMTKKKIKNNKKEEKVDQKKRDQKSCRNKTKQFENSTIIFPLSFVYFKIWSSEGIGNLSVFHVIIIILLSSSNTNCTSLLSLVFMSGKVFPHYTTGEGLCEKRRLEKT